LLIRDFAADNAEKKMLAGQELNFPHMNTTIRLRAEEMLQSICNLPLDKKPSL